MKIPNTQVTIRSEGRKEPQQITISDSDEKKTDTKKDDVGVKKETKPLYKIHPSVRKLFKVCPQIKLPNVCLKYDISPCVSMPMDAVENYFKFHKLDFQKYTKLALRAGRVATKKTSSVAKSKNVALFKPTTSSKIQKGERKNKAPRTEMKKEIVAPIKIKLPLPSSFTDVHVEIKPNSKNSNIFIKDLEQNPSQKRKLEIDKEEKKEVKKTNFIESLGLTPKVADLSGGPLSYVANKSLPLHICEICNSVQYSAKDLRKHQNRHLRCQFCKVKCRSLESKEEHLDTKCPIKNMMNHLPQVRLEKIEFNSGARKKYPEAFVDFTPFKDTEENSTITTNCDESASALKLEDPKNVEPKSDHNIPKDTAISETIDIIEILSDDEDPPPPLFSVNKGPSVNTPSVPFIPNATQCPQGDNVVYNTVSIVRPEIKIRGSSALDIIDARLTDIKVLKELLSHYRPVHLYADKNTQTELPANESISVNRSELTAEMNLFKPQLHVYKVPIIMKTGIFNVTFNYNAEPKPPKKLCLWNDMNIMDIKTPIAKTDLKSVPSENKNILPSTATYNSTGLFSAIPQATTSKFIRVNTSSLSPITTAAYTSPSSSVMNTLLNSILQNPMSPSTQSTVSATTTVQTSSVETPVTSSGQHFGTIRVKNVWELT